MKNILGFFSFLVVMLFVFTGNQGNSYMEDIRDSGQSKVDSCCDIGSGNGNGGW